MSRYTDLKDIVAEVKRALDWRVKENAKLLNEGYIQVSTALNAENDLHLAVDILTHEMQRAEAEEAGVLGLLLAPDVPPRPQNDYELAAEAVRHELQRRERTFPRLVAEGKLNRAYAFGAIDKLRRAHAELSAKLI